MRRLMWFSLGFAGACALCAYLPLYGLLLFSLIFFSAGVLCGLLSPLHSVFRRLAVLAVGCGVGFVWFALYRWAYLDTPAAVDGATETVTVRISEESTKSTYGVQASGWIRLEGKPYQVRAYLDTDKSLGAGDRVSAPFRFRVTTEDAAEGATYHQGKGIFLLLYQDGDLVIEEGKQSWIDIPEIMAGQIKQILRACFPEDTFPFAQALLLGDTEELGYETDTDLKISGIRHVAAVSGLHVSILFAMISALTARKRVLTALLGFPALLLFAAAAGFTPSVSRACLMCALMLLAPLFQKNYDGPTALAFAVLVLLAANPLSVTNAGLQLSAGSVAGIYLFSPGIRRWIQSLFGETKGKALKSALAGRVSGSVSVTLGAMLITTPLCAGYFGTVSLIGPVTNLLTLWVISFIFYGLIAVCLIELVWHGAAVMLGTVLSFPIRFVLSTAKALANLPLAAVYTRSPYILAWLIFVYALLICFLIWRRESPWKLTGCCVLGLCAALMASWNEPRMDSVRLTVLDVGQGQCLLIQNYGKTYMVDCGGDREQEAADIAAETLLSQGITRLDGLILTHLDRDHAGGAANLLTRVDTGLLILPAEYSPLAQCTDGEVVYATRDLKLTYLDTVISVFVPKPGQTDNENSLCILFDTEKCDILITGDRSASGERDLLDQGVVPDVDVLIAGHHGSKYSTCEELLRQARPEIVCISVGEDNPYGHPAPETLRRLEAFGCQVYRTDQNGEILIRR